jgi:hypothetical protein
MSLSEQRVHWPQACRIVPSRYPSINLFDRVAAASDFDALYALEALTNERLRLELGEIDRVPLDERLYGNGTGPIMAAFTHVNSEGSRFSAGSYGVFYAARERETAIAETRYHHARFLAATQQAATHLPMRLYHVVIKAKLHDLRPAGAVAANIYDTNDYTHARQLGQQLQQQGSAGVVYHSVRHNKGQCVGLFRPAGASACLHASYLLYVWDGSSFSDVYEKIE